ncbi:MAG TPA: hypothetical protein VEN81_10280 [Planctomycetota bacterium]|nr:hypothetical protein [Planctomycetota bacterium]
MKRLALLSLGLFAVASKAQDPAKDRLRQALGDTELVGTWIYDDLEAGYAEARRLDRPMMVVIRCVT